MEKDGGITDNYRTMLRNFIMADLPKDALLAIVEAIPSYPEKTIVIEPAMQAKPKRFNGRRKRQHPPPKSVDSKILARSIKFFCDNHTPQIKYLGMRNAIDALTTCKSPHWEDNDFYYEDHNFHYDCDYREDGVYLQRK